MEMIVVIALVWGGAFAIVRGTEYAWHAVKNGYRRRVKAWIDRNPAAPAPLGTKLGAGLATAATGTWLVGRGFAAGVKAGWPEGRERGRQWWERRHATDPAEFDEPATTDGSDAAPEATDAQADAGASPMQPPAEPADADDRPALGLVPPDTPAPAGAEHNTGGTPMAIVTATGGEILTMDQLMAELTAIITEAAADLDDAQADAKRASEDQNRVDHMVASLRSLDLDDQTLVEVGALAETAAMRRKAAEDRSAAAEARVGQAETALKGVQARHSQMREAVAATPHAAETSFYRG
jgi:hypothetical protein